MPSVAIAMMVAVFMGSMGMSIWIALPLVLLIGAAFGTLMGGIIQAFRLPPFLVTLAGMFLARGGALLLTEAKRIKMSGSSAINALSAILVADLSLAGMVFLAAVVVAALVARSTRFGRTVYAIGSDESAARSGRWAMALIHPRWRVGLVSVIDAFITTRGESAMALRGEGCQPRRTHSGHMVHRLFVEASWRL